MYSFNEQEFNFDISGKTGWLNLDSTVECITHDILLES